MRKVKSGLNEEEIGEGMDVAVARRREEESIGVGRHGLVAPPSGKPYRFSTLSLLRLRLFSLSGQTVTGRKRVGSSLGPPQYPLNLPCRSKHVI